MTAGPPDGQPPGTDHYGQPMPPHDSPQSGVPSPQSPPGSPYGQPQPSSPYPTAPSNPTGPYANPYANPAAPYGYPGAQPGYPPPPPPKKGIAGWIIGAILTAVVLVIAVCSFGGYLVIHQVNAFSTSHANASTSPTNQVPNTPSTEASPADGRPVIHPAGAPYSYRLPTGFHTVSVPDSPSTGLSAGFSSAVATLHAGGHDLLLVDSYALSYDANARDRTQLATGFDALVKRANQDPSTRQNVTYNGNFGFRYQFHYTSGNSAYSYFLFHGAHEIQVRCQWSVEETTIKTGCEDLLNSLTIAP